MKEIISTTGAPAALGPYSQAVKHNGTIYVSGQLPIDPATGALVTGTIAEQTGCVLKNISNILSAAGASLDNVLMVTIVLRDINDFAEFNGAYGMFFDKNPPARITYQAGALPKNASMEISVVAAL